MDFPPQLTDFNPSENACGGRLKTEEGQAFCEITRRFVEHCQIILR